MFYAQKSWASQVLLWSLETALMGLILSRIFVESFRCKRQLVKVAFEKSCPEWAQARKSCKEKKN